MSILRPERQASQTSPALRSESRHLADILLPVAFGLWAVGISQTHIRRLGSYGLLPNLPVVYYAGVALLVASAGIELARTEISRWRMAAHAVALTIMLYGTAPLVYPEGRYEWLYKTVGVVQYVNAHGALNRYIDVYNNWPGFFAFAAWFDKVAGVASPLAYAKWTQLAFELAAIPLLYLIYRALLLSARQRWAAILLYLAANWIGQDYFSPQALGTVLNLGVMAIALRWFYVAEPFVPRRRGSQGDGERAGFRTTPAITGQDETRARLAGTGGMLVALVLVYSVLTFTHELTPYTVAIQLGALSIIRLLRRRRLPVGLAAIAIAYLVPRFTFLESRYGLFKSVGYFLGAARPPSASVGAGTFAQVLIERSADLLSVGIWLLAILGWWLYRRSSRTAQALLVLAFSPLVLLFIQSYGQEGILRVYLYSLPWSAALGALALVPPRDPSKQRQRYASASALRTAVALGAAVLLFFPSFFGDDAFTTMTTGEVSVLTQFWKSARPGLVYMPNTNAPIADTARYNLFPLIPIVGSNSLLHRKRVTPEIANQIENAAQQATDGTMPTYVVVTPSVIAYNSAYPAMRPSAIRVLLRALHRSRAWRLVVHHAGTTIYKLPATASPFRRAKLPSWTASYIP